MNLNRYFIFLSDSADVGKNIWKLNFCWLLLTKFGVFL